jgi:dimethylamine/trimethylamine dehydrogenase
MSVDELHGPVGITHDGEAREIVETLAELPDLWDVNVSGALGNDSKSARFSPEGFQESYVRFVKGLTSKPVVGVGRFTTPETMLAQIRNGTLDFIGAARPSIADPFLPAKIRDGREDDIRECIGCNICYACDGRGVAIRCTQNPTMGEEWRRGWHPERIAVARSREEILVVGAGPAGLEAALSLGRRGYEVKLAEASDQAGGRLNWETKLPGLVEWGRVRDWRLHQISKLANVELFRGSRMTMNDVIDLDVAHVVLATGSRWRRDGRGRSLRSAVASFADARTVTPEEVMAGAALKGPVVIFDDDHYYVASALAERLAAQGLAVTYVTSEGKVSAWSEYTAEQARVHARLIECGVTIIVNSIVAALAPDEAIIQCAFTGRAQRVACGSFVPVTSREPEDALWQALNGQGLATLARIGDCKAPGLIAHAVYDGHKLAREFGEDPESLILRRERALA